MYKNPRLKHVKKIREVIADMPIYWQGYTDLILDQCNLLLEAKKKKKCKPSPQPDIKKLGELKGACLGYEGKLVFGFGSKEELQRFISKVEEIIDQVNKLTKTK